MQPENMQHPSNTGSTQSGTQAASSFTARPPEKKGLSILVKIFIASGILALLFFGGLFGLTLYFDKTPSTTTPAAKLFYSMLFNTAQKTQVHFAHYDVSYQSQADKDAGKIDLLVESLSEFNTKTKQYSTAFVSGDPDFPGNGRCVNGQEYKIGRYLFDSFAAAEQALNQSGAKPTPPSQYDKYGPCVYTSGLRHGKLSDGVIPIGFSNAQATSWLNYLKSTGLFDLKDEGRATYNGQAGRKISFTLGKHGPTQLTTDYLFYAQRDGTTGKIGGINMDFTLFDRILDPANGTNLKGFYIIDEKNNLPIYSEMEAVAVPGDKFLPLSTKQHYSFPDKLTMDANTPIEDLVKL